MDKGRLLVSPSGIRRLRRFKCSHTLLSPSLRGSISEKPWLRQSNQPLESKDDIALITRSRFDRVILEPTIANAFQQFEALVSRK